MSKRRLDPKNDVVFKMLFTTSEPALLGLLNAVLKPKRPFVKATVRNPDIPKHFPADKPIVLDILAEQDDGTLVDVEMQCRGHEALRERVIYYLADVYSGQLVAGDDYSQLAPAVSVLILDYREFDFPHFHETFRLRGDLSEEVFSRHLEIHTLELPKVQKGADSEDDLVAWCRFFRSKDPLEVEQLAAQNPAIAMAERRLEELSLDPQARELARARHRQEMGARIELGAIRRRLEEVHRLEDEVRQRVEEARRRVEEAEEKALKALAEGRAEVLLDGQRTLLRKLLARIGTLSAENEARLSRAKEEELTLWAERTHSATSIEDVFG